MRCVCLFKWNARGNSFDIQRRQLLWLLMCFFLLDSLDFCRTSFDWAQPNAEQLNPHINFHFEYHIEMQDEINAKERREWAKRESRKQERGEGRIREKEDWKPKRKATEWPKQKKKKLWFFRFLWFAHSFRMHWRCEILELCRITWKRFSVFVLYFLFPRDHKEKKRLKSDIKFTNCFFSSFTLYKRKEIRIQFNFIDFSINIFVSSSIFTDDADSNDSYCPREKSQSPEPRHMDDRSALHLVGLFSFFSYDKRTKFVRYSGLHSKLETRK